MTLLIRSNPKSENITFGTYLYLFLFVFHLTTLFSNLDYIASNEIVIGK
jgi:hypothetical protein